jgi:hypothetical protein
MQGQCPKGKELERQSEILIEQKKGAENDHNENKHWTWHAAISL